MHIINPSGKYTFAGIIAAVFICGLNCSQLSLYEEKDSSGRITRSVSYVKNEPDTITTIKYIGNTDKALSKEFIKLKNAAPYHSWIESYQYTRGRISTTKFFIDINNSKIQSGKIIYKYDNEKETQDKSQIEYYSLSDLNEKNFFMHGVDIYTYADIGLLNRRIIEYEQNPETHTAVQVSQYVIHYADYKKITMETRMLDKKSNSIVNREEINLKIIKETIENIEKSLIDRCRGYTLVRKEQ